MTKQIPNEPVLPDEHPIFDMTYVADGKPFRPACSGITVAELKALEGFREVRRCNLAARCGARHTLGE